MKRYIESTYLLMVTHTLLLLVGMMLGYYIYELDHQSTYPSNMQIIKFSRDSLGTEFLVIKGDSVLGRGRVYDLPIEAFNLK